MVALNSVTNRLLPSKNELSNILRPSRSLVTVLTYLSDCSDTSDAGSLPSRLEAAAVSVLLLEGRECHGPIPAFRQAHAGTRGLLRQRTTTRPEGVQGKAHPLVLGGECLVQRRAFLLEPYLGQPGAGSPRTTHSL